MTYHRYLTGVMVEVDLSILFLYEIELFCSYIDVLISVLLDFTVSPMNSLPDGPLDLVNKWQGIVLDRCRLIQEGSKQAIICNQAQRATTTRYHLVYLVQLLYFKLIHRKKIVSQQPRVSRYFIFSEFEFLKYEFSVSRGLTRNKNKPKMKKLYTGYKIYVPGTGYMDWVHLNYYVNQNIHNSIHKVISLPNPSCFDHPPQLSNRGYIGVIIHNARLLHLQIIQRIMFQRNPNSLMQHKI